MIIKTLFIHAGSFMKRGKNKYRKLRIEKIKEELRKGRCDIHFYDTLSPEKAKESIISSLARDKDFADVTAREVTLYEWKFFSLKNLGKLESPADCF